MWKGTDIFGKTIDADVESALACIVENRGEYHSIVPLAGQMRSHRDRYC